MSPIDAYTRSLDLRLAVACVVICAASLCACAPAGPSPLAITGATLIDGTDAPPRPGTTILIEDGVIAAVGPDVEVPRGARTIDAAGRHVIPGLAEMHAHFGVGDVPTSERLDAVNRRLRQFLFYGVTTILNVGATGGGVDEILHIRKLQAEGQWTGPTVYATGGLLTVPGSHPVATIMAPPPGQNPETYDWSRSGVWVVETAEQVREVVRRMAAAGMDGIKVIVESGPLPFGDDHPQMPPSLIAAAVDEGRRVGLPVFAHATSDDELEDAVEAGVRSVVHFVADSSTDRRVFAAMRDKEVFFVSTLSLAAGYLTPMWRDQERRQDAFLRAGFADSEIDAILGGRAAEDAFAELPNGQELWDGIVSSVREAHAAGVKIATGADPGNPFAFPGYGVHVEMELLVAAGLTPMEAIVAATRRAAEMVGRADVFGTIEPGKRADLLVLGSDPLQDIRNTRTLEVVVSGGRVVDRQELLRER